MGCANRKKRLFGLYLALCGLLTACSEEPASTIKQTTVDYIETGDLSAIKTHQKLRVLIPRTEGKFYLPRDADPLDIELAQIKQFATSHGLELTKVYVPDFDKLIPELLQGKGDIIAANLTVTEKRKELIDFSISNSHASQLLIQAAGHTPVTKHSQLNRLNIAAKPSTAYWETLQSLKAKQPEIQLTGLENHLEIDEILDRLVQGKFDATLFDSNQIASLVTYRNDIQSTLRLSKELPIAYGVRPDSPELKKALQVFIQKQKLAQRDNKLHTADWADIKKRKVIRVLTRNNAANYFLYRGELLGFEYELARQFAQQHNLRLEIVVPPEHDDLIEWLNQGKGDIIAASLSPSVYRETQNIIFSRHYLFAKHMLVQRNVEAAIDQLEQLNGRTISIRKSSAYLDTVNKLLDQGLNITVEFVPEDIETEDIINLVAIGKYDLTISDSHLLELELKWRSDISSALALTDDIKVGWAVRDSNPELLKVINRFHKKTYKSLFYNLTYQKYFENPARITTGEDRSELKSGVLSPYDDLVKKHAETYGFDWKLITAQMYQESRFNPQAKSWAGAVGLLQVMPKTGAEFGFLDLHEPDTGLHAGIKYLDWVQDRFEDELPVKDRMWFSLAAYNAGIGHVWDARRLARKMGWNADRWFNNVERAMLLLRLKKYYKQSRFGFVRGSEPVKYVREIKHHFEAYTKLLTADAAMLTLSLQEPAQ